MKKLALFLFFYTSMSFGQGNPFAAYMWNGSAWTPATTTGTAQALTWNPPPASMYCFNSGLSEWVAADSSCFGGGGGGSGTVTSVTFTGDGVVDSSTPSTAVTTSGTVTATINTQVAHSILGNFTGSTAAPTFSATPTFAITNLTGTCTACTSNAVTGLTFASGKTLTVNNSLTLAGTDSTTMTFPSSSATIPGVGIANTFSAAQTISAAGAASTSPLLMSGAWETGGSATTNYPALYIKGSGASDGNLNTQVSGLVVNAATGCTTGYLLAAQLNGAAPTFSSDCGGNTKFTGNVTATSNTVSVNSSGFQAIKLASNTGLTISSNTSQAGTNDAGIDRAAANVIEANLGTAAASGGSFRAASFQSAGTTFTVSGCGTAGSVTGGASAGTFTVGTGTTNCTFTVTINGATGLTAAHGWIANADDTTAGIHCINSATVSATTVIFVCTGTVATNDVIKFTAMAY